MRLIFITILLFFSFNTMFGQLNVYAKHIKEQDSARFNMLKRYAVLKWNTVTDIGLIEYEINKQSEGYVNVMALLNEHWECQSHKTTILMGMLRYSNDSDDFKDANWWRIYMEIKSKLN